ncbi:MAG: PIG-L family deacetylase [Planctomycetota bacterium]|nr:PIG-L family deacetylase [Planctomycetota bacterium]
MPHAHLDAPEPGPGAALGRAALVLVTALALLGSAGAQTRVHLNDVAGDGIRALCVVAHPDDEIAFSGTVYKIATHLGGAVDVVVITNGEAGYKYSLLAERIYGLKLTDPAVGRRELPRIRQQEMTEACRLLGVRDVDFLGQQDHRYNQDANEVLGPDRDIWDLGFVRSTLDARLGEGRYDFVFVHLPTPTTHGHHQAASILALEAVARRAPHARPVVLGSYPTRIAEDAEPPPDMLEGRPVTRHIVGDGPYVFDLLQKFGFREKLDYRVVTNLAATQHRSQGTYLLSVGRREAEGFVRFALETPDADARARELFARLAEPQFEPMDYDEDGNLIERR